MLGVGHVHVADDIDDTAVGLFGQALVLTAIASFHVEDRNMQALGTDDTETGVGVAQDQYCVGVHFYHQLITFGNNIAHGLAQVVTYSLHIHIRVG